MNSARILAAICLALLSTPSIAKKPQTPVTSIEPGSIYENVCHLDVYRKGQNGHNQSTAVLFDKRYLITAGHNILQARRSITKIDVRCGVANAKESPVQQSLEGWRSQRAKRFTFWRIFPSSRDFGVILLKEPIETARPISFSDAALKLPDRDSEEKGEEVCIYGYPGDTFSDAYTLFEGCQPLVGLAGFSNGVGYDVKTYTGNSGGPVVRHTSTGPELVAIHVQPSSGRVAERGFQGEVRALIRTLEQRAAERAQ